MLLRNSTDDRIVLDPDETVEIVNAKMGVEGNRVDLLDVRRLKTDAEESTE